MCESWNRMVTWLGEVVELLPHAPTS